MNFFGGLMILDNMENCRESCLFATDDVFWADVTRQKICHYSMIAVCINGKLRIKDDEDMNLTCVTIGLSPVPE